MLSRRTNTPINIYLNMPFIDIYYWINATLEVLEEEVKATKNGKRNV